MRALWLCSAMALVLGFTTLGCSGDAQEDQTAASKHAPAGVAGGLAAPAAPTSDAVAGTLRHTAVQLAHAEFDGDLAIFAGESWGFSPSLLIFLFLKDGESIEGREFRVRATDGFQMGTPHVHYRWRNPETGDVDVEAVMDGYDMQLTFGEVRDGWLTGRIDFSVPGEDTHVRGHFRAKMKEH